MKPATNSKEEVDVCTTSQSSKSNSSPDLKQKRKNELELNALLENTLTQLSVSDESESSPQESSKLELANNGIRDQTVRWSQFSFGEVNSFNDDLDNEPEAVSQKSIEEVTVPPSLDVVSRRTRNKGTRRI